MPCSIFINYRRSDEHTFAGRIADRLGDYFGEVKVFHDVEKIKFGEDFVKVFLEEVRNCQVFLAVIGPNWLVQLDHSGRRRLDNEKDPVRIEIAEAITLNKMLIPVLVNGAKPLRETDLPSNIQDLAKLEAAEITNKQFKLQMSALIERIEEVLPSEAFTQSAPKLFAKEPITVAKAAKNIASPNKQTHSSAGRLLIYGFGLGVLAFVTFLVATTPVRIYTLTLLGLLILGSIGIEAGEASVLWAKWAAATRQWIIANWTVPLVVVIAILAIFLVFNW